MDIHKAVNPHGPSKPSLRSGRLQVDLIGDGGPGSYSRFTETVRDPEFTMVPGDGRIPYVDLEGDRSIQVAFQPDGVRVLMDEVCASVLTDGTIVCTMGSTTVTMMPDGSVRVAQENGSVVLVTAAGGASKSNSA